MRRVLVITILGFIFFAMWQAVLVNFPQWINLFFLPPVALVFSLQFFKPLETIAVSLSCGFITDVLGGFALGSNMLVMLLLAFFLGAFNLFSGRVHRKELVYYVIFISFIYRVTMLIGFLIFFGKKANLFLLQLLLGPFVDGLISIVLYNLLVRLLALVKALDHTDFFKNRIGLH